MILPINFSAVTAAALAAFILGFLFHGPLLGRVWMKLADIHPTGKEKFADMIPQLVKNFMANFITAFVLAVIYLFAAQSPYIGATGIWRGVICALWLWLGFLVTTTSIEVIWMGRKPQLWLYECACSLVVMAAMGAIIAHWSTVP